MNNQFNKEINIEDKFAEVAANDFSNGHINVLNETFVEQAKLNKFTPIGIAPSEYLPKRTAKFWSEVIMGREPLINFFKDVGNKTEVHENGTKGWRKVIDNNALLSVLRETEYELSLDGESDIALFNQGNKIVPLKIELIQKKYNPDGSLRFYHGLVNMDQGTAPWILSKKFYYNDKGEVIVENVPYTRRDFQGSDGNTLYSEWKNVSVDSFNKKYKADIYKTKNLGMIEFPVFTFTNTGNDRWGSGMSDTTEVKDILTRLDAVEQAIDAAISTSKTRVIKKKVNGSMDLAGIASVDPEIQQLDASTDVIELTVDPHNPDGTLQISDRALNADQWYAVRDKLLNQYYTYTGENVAADAHGNNQHTFEVQSKGDNKYRKGTAKKNQRTKEIIGLINGVISYAKSLGVKDFVGLDKVSVNIDVVDIRKEYEIEDKVEKLLKLGLISKIQGIGMIMNVDEEVATMLISNRVKHLKIEEDNEPKEKPQVQPEMPIVEDGEAEDIKEKEND